MIAILHRDLYIVSLLLLVTLSGCAQGTVERSETEKPPVSDTPTSAPTQATSPPVQIIDEKSVNQTPTPTETAEIVGLVVAESDAGNVPDSPLEKQLVLIMAQEKAARLFGEEANLRFTQKDVPLDDPEIITLVTDGEGIFSTNLLPGEMVLCLADEFSEGVATTRGCGQFTVQKGPNTLTVSVGFGEILLDTG